MAAIIEASKHWYAWVRVQPDGKLGKPLRDEEGGFVAEMRRVTVEEALLKGWEYSELLNAEWPLAVALLDRGGVTEVRLGYQGPIREVTLPRVNLERGARAIVGNRSGIMLPCLRGYYNERTNYELVVRGSTWRIGDKGDLFRLRITQIDLPRTLAGERKYNYN